MSQWEAESLVDELAPDAIDWRDWVRRYPIPSLIVAGIAGYLIGRDRGEEILETAKARATDTINDNVDQLISTRR